MTKYDLINILTDNEEEEEVLIKIDDTLYEIDVEHVPETFDGFDTVYPASIALVPKIDES